jgi:soluble lytic murein transglycosylase-like protein
MDTAVILAGGVGAFLLLASRPGVPGLSVSGSGIHAQAKAMIEAQGWQGRVSPCMVAAMVQIESGGNPLAVRPEVHLGDASVGLMQTLVRTAQWLWDDMGYRARPRPTAVTLLVGDVSLYFGAAYIHYLSRYAGVARNERWIVESYNGGPGKSNAQTARHFVKYQAARAALGC